MFADNNQHYAAGSTEVTSTSRKYFTAVLHSHLSRITHRSTQYNTSLEFHDTPFILQMRESWCKCKENESVLDLANFYTISRSEIELVSSKQTKKILHPERVEKVRNTPLNHAVLLQDFLLVAKTCTLTQFKKYIFAREMVCYNR